MNNVNKTLYIPLYGKSYVSQKGIILQDKQAEKIWAAEGFSLKGKAKSKWLAYYMGMRSAVFDHWIIKQLSQIPEAIVLHIGCGLDSRCLRISSSIQAWYDIDFPEVIAERKRFFQETDTYHMLGTDARTLDLQASIPHSNHAIIVMEGLSMYMPLNELQALLGQLTSHFTNVKLLFDCYSEFAAKASKYKNPINEVGVTKVYGIDDPLVLTKNTGLRFVQKHIMTPDYMIHQLDKTEQFVFKKLYSGKIADKMYRLYEYTKEQH